VGLRRSRVSRRRLSLAACFLSWIISRLFLVYAIGADIYLGPKDIAIGDLRGYHRWAATLFSGGGLPIDDPAWQYPPGAAAVFVFPELLPGSYGEGFVGLMLVFDAAILGILALRGPTRAGAWLWVLGGTALGPLLLARFDLVPTTLAVAGLAVATPVLSGALLGLGGWIKIWPTVLALRGATWGTAARRLAGAAIVIAAGLGAIALGGELDRALGFLQGQRYRGLQIESVAATPLLLHSALSGRPSDARHIVFEYGALTVTGPGVHTAILLCTLASLAAIAWYSLSALIALRRGTGPTESSWRALALVLLLMITSRVLSPQYMIWALGVGGLVVASRSKPSQIVAALLLFAAVLSQWVFPFHYRELRSGDLIPTLVLAVRNTTLIAAACIAVWCSGRNRSAPHARPSRSKSQTTARGIDIGAARRAP
jgi:Glycosyltransferase family 87